MSLPWDCSLEMDWHECEDWLRRCGLLESVERRWPRETASEGEEELLRLVREMTDGVLPLAVLRRLSGGLVEPSKYAEYSPSPATQSQFDRLSNLKLFNRLALKYFAAEEAALVEPARLCCGKDFGRFVRLLSQISKSDFARSSGITGFPMEDHEITAEHEYYNQLEDIVVKHDIYTTRRRENDYNNKNQDEEKVYETLVQHKHPSTMDVPANKSGREMCISEIVESERNYVESLQILINGYKIPMSSHLSSNEVETIFKYIEDFLKIHRNLHMKITIAIMPNKANINQTTKLHEVFIESKQSMLLYGNYCANMQIAQNLVQDMIKTNSYKRAQLEKCQEASNKFRKFPLSDLLTLPMQRVLKYHLLFQTLLKWTLETHEDYEGLKLAHETMTDLARFVNDVKRDQEAIISIDKIQSEMMQIHLPKGKRLADYGRRQKDGELKVQLEMETKPKLRHVFIFDKMILLAKRKGDIYDFKHAFYLPDKLPEKTNIQPRKPEKVYPFKINIGLKKDDLTSIILFTKSEEMRKQWMDAVTTAIENQYPPGSKCNGYAFDMTNFVNYETCYFCKKLFSGIFYQGYMCRKTGIVSHKSCIPPPQSQSNRASLIRRDSDPLTFRNSINNIHKTSLHNDLSRETNGHRMDFRMQSEPLRDTFDMTPFSDLPNFINSNNGERTDSYDNEPWYVGEMEREEANTLLQNNISGTFLVRLSKNQRRPGEYSLSIKDREPKHMKIQKSCKQNTFYLEEANKFSDLKELVKYYSRTSLNEYFIKLEVADLKLSYPLKTVMNPFTIYQAIAIENSPLVDEQANVLTFKKGDIIHILKEDSIGSGWLCGSINNVQGLVPSLYVRRLSSS